MTHLRDRMEVSRLLHEMPKPTIAMVNGPAAGAGMSLALACDLRIARTISALRHRFREYRIFTGKAREFYYTADRLMLFRSRPCPAVTVGSPVYFGNMMGEVKMFFDNWLLNPDRHLVNTDH